MLEIEVAEHAGACYGVERALTLAYKTSARATGDVYTLGPLIHNPVVVAELEERGVRVAKSVSEVPSGSTLILRTHGVAPSVAEEAKAAGLTVVDATCPFVDRCHDAARRLGVKGYQVVIVGEAGHPETEATAAEAEGTLILGSAADVRAAELGRWVGLVCQTTIAEDTLAEVAGAVAPRATKTKIINTICEATRERQEATRELASRVDVMVVLGGRSSANTRHLCDVAREACQNVYHIERETELDEGWFEGASHVGLTAGASTPKRHIDACASALEAVGRRAG